MKTEIIEQLKGAFSLEELPEDDLFIYSAGHIFDSEQATQNLRIYKNWEDIPDDILVRNRDRMSYLTPYGFKFLLPAFLRMAIEKPHEADVLTDNLVFNLTPSTVYIDLIMERAKILSTSQIKFIILFFQSYFDIYPPSQWSTTESDIDIVKQAADFWQELLDTSS